MYFNHLYTLDTVMQRWTKISHPPNMPQPISLCTHHVVVPRQSMVLPAHTDMLSALAIWCLASGTVCPPSTSHCRCPLHATATTLSILPPSPSQLLHAPDAATAVPTAHTHTATTRNQTSPPVHLPCLTACMLLPLPPHDITCTKCLLELWGWGGLVDGLGARPTQLVEWVTEGLEFIYAAQQMGACCTRARALQQGAGKCHTHSMNNGLHKLGLGQIGVCGNHHCV